MALADGGPGFVQIALTNRCNAKCSFCLFGQQDKIPNKVTLTYEQAARAVDILFSRGIRYFTYVGGEPLLHPNLVEICSYTSQKGGSPLVCTNGSLLNEEYLLRLRDAGLSNLILSIDSPEESVHDRNRGLPGCSRKIREAARICRRLGIRTTASVTLSRLIADDLDRLPEYLSEVGFDALTFSYPLTELKSSYLSFNQDCDLVSYKNGELVALYRKVKELRRRFPVVNPDESLDDMIAFAEGRPQRFECLGGYKYFYVDWNLKVWRCHYWHEPMCSLEEFPNAPLIRDGCQKCMIDCYRDPSVFQYSAVAISDALSHMARGRLVPAIRSVFNRRMYHSLKAVAANWRWLTGY